MERGFIILIYLMPLVLLSEDYTINGSVKDSEGDAISEVHITLTPSYLTLYSDTNGSFYFKNIPSGSYTLSFQHIGFLNSTLEVTVSDSDITLNSITLEHEVLYLGKVVVTASRTERDVKDIPESVSVVSSREIRERNSKTSAEALREEVGVFVQKTNHGGGSAIIRGLRSNQILLLVDGIRLNNSIYRLGNHQYLTTVDHQIVERMEIVRGPTSVLYGSDALGGTINLITRKPYPNSAHKVVAIRSFFRYATADKEQTLSGEVNTGNKQFAFSTAFSLKQFGDIRRGQNGVNPEIYGNELIQSPTAFSGYDIDSKLISNFSKGQSLTLVHQISNQSKVPRYDKYQYSGYKRWIYQPQKRALSYAVYENSEVTKLFDSIKMNMSLHAQKEGREIQITETSPIEKELDGVSTLGFGLIGERDLDSHRFITGAELYQDYVSSERGFIDPVSRVRTESPRGRYPNGSYYQSFGIYVQDEIAASDRLLIKVGLRYSRYKAGFNIASVDGIISYKQPFSATTGAIGSVIKITEYISLNLNIAEAFRAPNLSDMAKLGQSKGNVYEVPNRDLKPEKLLNTDVGMKIISPKLRMGLTFYQSTITNILASNDAIYAGRDTIVLDGQTFKIKTKKNVGEAIIKGAELSFDYSYNPKLIIRANLTTTQGENISLNEPVGGIPPLFGLAGIRLNHGRTFVDGYTRFAGRQNKLSSDDLDDPRILKKGTPQWYTVNIRGGITLRKNFILQIALENILDRNYREHGSGINSPGRNLVFSLQASL